MSKRFWAGVLLVSLLATGGAASYLYVALVDKSLVEVPLTKEETKTPEPDQPSQSAVQEKPVEEETQPAPAKPAATFSTEKEDVRNILFTYKNSVATDVQIIGDFNNWMRSELKRKNGALWTVAIQMKPGRYEYQYVVDGRKIKDPNNKTLSPSGKSLLTVKPLDN